MHDAYKALPLIEKLPLQIESFAVYDDNLLVGTKQGHLLVYHIVPPITSPDNHYEVQLVRSNKCFAKKPITQLAVVPDFHIVISLSDNVISVYDLTKLHVPLMILARSKGATLFAIDVKKTKADSGKAVSKLRLCAAVRKKLQLYYWNERTFSDLGEDLNVPDIPKVVVWCGESLCVGFRGEYCLIKVTGAQKDLFPTGKYVDPRITKLVDDKFALGRDEHTILLDLEGSPTQKYPITFSETPLQMEHDPPYFVAILPKFIEVRTNQPRLHIQNIELPKPKFITRGARGQLFVASSSHIWCLVLLPISEQIPALLKVSQFELALKLADVAEEDENEKKQRIQKIQNLYAFNLFCKLQFQESLDIFYELGTDPSHVIGLFPDLLPQVYRDQLKYPDEVPVLSGGVLETGLLALIDYLNQKRHSLINNLEQNANQSTAIVEGNATIESNKQLLQIIDTTLLKCYLQTNDALVAALLRLPDNHCHVEECERALKRQHKYSELIILYDRKKLHQKALDLLSKQAKNADSPLKGHDKTIQYLQHLGKENLSLIFDFAGWVLKAHPEDGLKIFTENMPEVTSLPRDAVLNYLQKTEKSLVIRYLEYIVSVWDDETPHFHNTLIFQYLEKLQSLKSEISTLSPEDTSLAALTKRKEGVELRNKLTEFLKTSQHYNPQQIIIRFPYDDLFEERAVLMGKIGRHEQALAIYTHILKNSSQAEEYCQRVYDPTKEGRKDVYLMLLKLYAAPTESALMGVIAPTSVAPEPNIPAALKLLIEHPSEIDPIKALEIVPSTISVQDIRSYLDHVILAVTYKKRWTQVQWSLSFAEHLQIKEQRIYHQATKITINEFNNCTACKKRIGNSAFARYPNGDIVHYFCKEKYQAAFSE